MIKDRNNYLKRIKNWNNKRNLGNKCLLRDYNKLRKKKSKKLNNN